jgi:hypothetical protein
MGTRKNHFITAVSPFKKFVMEMIIRCTININSTARLQNLVRWFLIETSPLAQHCQVAFINISSRVPYTLTKCQLINSSIWRGEAGGILLGIDFVSLMRNSGVFFFGKTKRRVQTLLCGVIAIMTSHKNKKKATLVHEYSARAKIGYYTISLGIFPAAFHSASCGLFSFTFYWLKNKKEKKRGRKKREREKRTVLNPDRYTVDYRRLDI